MRTTALSGSFASIRGLSLLTRIGVRLGIGSGWAMGGAIWMGGIIRRNVSVKIEVIFDMCVCVYVDDYIMFVW